MISFFRFLFEHEFRQFKMRSWVHTGHTKSGHKVQIHLQDDPHESTPRSYSVSFDARYHGIEWNEEPEHAAEGREVTHYVFDKVRTFIKEKKPHTIYVYGDTDRKHITWGHFTKQLARRFGGDY